MTSNEIVTRQSTDIDAQMKWAQAVTSTDRGSILPNEYRGNPANVLIAVGLGASMGLSPAESLYRISVIKGRPSAGAELIAANVRKAGHKLRVRGDETTCTATIVRADDPDFEFTVTRDMAWAKGMGLAGNDNYKKQPGTMLQWRAITAVARLACPEALYGVTYTPDELGDIEPAQQHTSAARPTGLSAVRAAVQQPEPEPVQDDTEEAEVVDDQPEAVSGKTDLTDKTRGRLFALFAERNITDRGEQIRGISHIIGRQIQSRSELTEADAQAVIDQLASMAGAN